MPFSSLDLGESLTCSPFLTAQFPLERLSTTIFFTSQLAGCWVVELLSDHLSESSRFTSCHWEGRLEQKPRNRIMNGSSYVFLVADLVDWNHLPRIRLWIQHPGVWSIDYACGKCHGCLFWNCELDSFNLKFSTKNVRACGFSTQAPQKSLNCLHDVQSSGLVRAPQKKANCFEILDLCMCFLGTFCHVTHITGRWCFGGGAKLVLESCHSQKNLHSFLHLV